MFSLPIAIGSALMGPLINSAIGSIGNGISNVAKAIAPFAGAGLDFFGGLLTNQSNADEAARNRRFVAQMYKKRYQFTVDDMRKAGLNPVLAANGGSVGSAPSGSMATFTNPVHGAIGSALQAMSSLQGLENAKSQKELIDAQAQLTKSKKVEADINNLNLPVKARALAEKAEADASLANSASVIQYNRAKYAQVLAQYEAYQRRHEAGKAKWDFNESQRKFRSQLPMDIERNLRYHEWRAKIRALEAAPWLKGLNSAAGLLRAF